jgi:hypothetical protein
MNGKKINLKTAFKFISEYRIRKNINFRKHFPKTIYEGKIGILEGSKEIFGGGREKFTPDCVEQNNHSL